MPAWEELGAFLDEDDFGILIDIFLDDGSQLDDVPAIFDDPYLDAQLGEYRFDTTSPRIMVEYERVKAVSRGDVCLIGGVEYNVLTAPQNDGTGLATIQLAPSND